MTKKQSGLSVLCSRLARRILPAQEGDMDAWAERFMRRLARLPAWRQEKIMDVADAMLKGGENEGEGAKDQT